MSRILDRKNKQIVTDQTGTAHSVGGRKGVKRTTKKKESNLLDMVPTRTCEWTRQKEHPELVRILKARFDTKFGEHLGKKLNLDKTYNINLDEYGTAVWRLCDGKMTVRDIGEILKTQFNEEIEPLYPRLAAFLKVLKSNDTIELTTGMKSKNIKRKL